MGKIILIEGTDCSGKETQSNILEENLLKDGYKVFKMSFPVYDSPTGKIVGGPYLGKESISSGWFKEGANNVPAKVASLYYAADRLYNVGIIKEYLDKDYIVLLDRYVTSNMAHQGGKIKDKFERLEMFKWLEKLEYDLLELPKPDIKIFLHLPYEYSKELSKNRKELDEHERSEDNMRHAELAYEEMADLYNFIKIEEVRDNKIRSIEDISKEIYTKIKEELENE